LKLANQFCQKLFNQKLSRANKTCNFCTSSRRKVPKTFATLAAAVSTILLLWKEINVHNFFSTVFKNRVFL